MSWGAMGGGFGPGGAQSSAAAGLPFAGVPEELRTRAEAILDREPEHPDPGVRFDARSPDERPFTLRRFLAAHRLGLALATVLVIIEALSLQAGPLLTQRGIDDGISKGDERTLVVVALVYIATVIVSIVAGSLRVAWTGRLGERLLYDLRLRVFGHLQRLSIDYYTDEKAGRVLTRMTSDIEALQQLFQDGLVNLAVQVLTMTVVTVILLTLQPALAVITVVAVVPAMAVVTIWFRVASDRAYNVVRDRIADVLADLSESLAGIRVITAFNRRRNNVYAHRNIVGRYRDANVQTAEINARYGPATDMIGSVGQVVVLAIGGKMVLDGNLSIGELTAFVLYLTAFFAPIQQLVQLYTTYQQGKAAVVKLRDLLGTAPSVRERGDAGELPPVRGDLDLEHVTFGYQADRPVLHEVSLHIAAGETFALVGPTGAGKSTIAKLITRFYDPQGGVVRIDGVDLREVTLASLRRQLGVVP